MGFGDMLEALQEVQAETDKTGKHLVTFKANQDLTGLEAEDTKQEFATTKTKLKVRFKENGMLLEGKLFSLYLFILLFL